MHATLLAGGSSLAIALAYAPCAQGADAAATGAASVAEIVVTGTHIAGSPQDSALPVSVISTLSLEKQGSPTLVELVKTLPGVYASYGESDRLLGNVGGIASINLRGFGDQRTLVLLNGERLAATTPVGGEDVNLIPTAAIGRVEILKDGAATAYGSDAIAGVVNFITRRDLKGFEINGNYSLIDHSHGGDYTVNALYGWQWDRGDALITAGYLRRSQVRIRDIGFAFVPGQAGFNTANGAGGWSGASNPGRFLAINTNQLAAGTLPSTSTAAATSASGTGYFDDDGCLALGGANAAGSTQCRFHYSAYDNLVNDEYHYQVHGQINFKISDTVDFHAEASWVRHDVPSEPFSPTQSTVNFPTPIVASGGSPGGGTSPFPATGASPRTWYYIPFSNPGLTQYYNTHCVGVGATPAYCNNLANGVITSPTAFRSAGYGGNLNYPDGANHQSAMATAARFATWIEGTINEDLKWKVNADFEQVQNNNRLPDQLIDRLEFALRGLGGPNCNQATGAPGVGGCQYYNPFSNGIPSSKVNGAANPNYLGATNPALNNDPTLFNWMMGQQYAKYTTTVATVDPEIDGKVPFIHLPGGQIDFAVGGQIRYNRYQLVTNTQANLGASPCPDSILTPGSNCAGVGPYIFYPALANYDVHSNIEAIFAEFHLPITHQLNASAAVRYENYGKISSTVPKFDVKWQPIGWFALRGSVGSTLRAPTALQTAPGSTATLATFTDPTNGTALYRAVSIAANPNLQPETAVTYDVGGIFEGRNFQFTVDYYRFDFKNAIYQVAANQFFVTMFPSANPATWQCGNTTLVSHFVFVSDVCSPGNVLQVNTSSINANSINTSGLDFQGSYSFNDFFHRRNQLTLGGDATYLLDYQQSAVTIEGNTVQPAKDYAGLVEDLAGFYSYPRLRGNVYANYSDGPHNLRLTLRYQGVLRDVNLASKPVRDYFQLDAIYQLALPHQTQLTFGIDNLFDRKPSYVVSQYNYDYTTGNPLGRVFQFGLKKHF